MQTHGDCRNQNQIWMYYSIVHLMKYSINLFEIKTIELKFASQEKVYFILQAEND